MLDDLDSAQTPTSTKKRRSARTELDDLDDTDDLVVNETGRPSASERRIDPLRRERHAVRARRADSPGRAARNS